MTDISTGATGAHVHLTTTQLLARYDAEQRRAAAESGKPLRRAAHPGIAGVDLSGAGAYRWFLHVGRGSKVLAMSLNGKPSGSGPEALSFPLLTALLSEALNLDGEAPKTVTGGVVFADRATFNRVVALSGRWATTRDTVEARQVARILAYRASLPSSAFLPILTEALGAAWWLPVGGNLDDLDDWSAALSLSPDRVTGVRAALGLVTDGHVDRAVAKAMVGAECYGMRASAYASVHSSCSAFTKAESFNEAYAAMVAVDPLLRERNILAGTVSRIRIHQLLSDRVEALVETPGKLREDSKVLVFDGHEAGKACSVTLRSMNFRNDRLYLDLSKPRWNTNNGHLIAEAQDEGRALYVTPAPFLGVSRSPSNRRWTSGDAVEFGGSSSKPVDIPVDVALAGAPLAD